MIAYTPESDLTDAEIASIERQIAAWRTESSGWFPWKFEVRPNTDENGDEIDGRHVEITSTLTPDELAFQIYRECGKLSVLDGLQSGHDCTAIDSVEDGLRLFRAIVYPEMHLVAA